MNLKTSPPEYGQISHLTGAWLSNLKHDAAYAHAMIQAMDEFRPRIGWTMWDTAIPMITERADEIMRGFGYTEEAQ